MLLTESLKAGQFDLGFRHEVTEGLSECVEVAAKGLQLTPKRSQLGSETGPLGHNGNSSSIPRQSSSST